ncbi:endonuclease/exonuclease/phosphatase, partial [Chloroflexota bacterium]
NTITEEGVSVNFPFLDIHPDRSDVFKTNARLSQTYDQIGLFSRDKRLPTHKDNETIMGKNPVGPDYGVFNLTELFAKALDVGDSEQGALIKRFEHKVSDHMPLWLRLPLPEKTPV